MDESFRDILPYLRPRSGEVSWAAWVALLMMIMIIVASAVAALLTRQRQKREMWRTFEATAEERGLTKGQRRLLARIARRARMRNPMLLLGSLKFFDRHVGGRAAELMGRDGRGGQRIVDNISQMRKLLGFDRLQPGQSVLTTRQLQPGQLLMVWPEKGGPDGFVECAVVARDDRALVAVPLLKDGDYFLTPLAAGDRIKARFWDKDDVEYRFRTEILDAVAATTTVLIRHAERLERIQQHDFFRLRVEFPISFLAIARKVYETASLEEAVREQRVEQIEGQLFYVSGDGLGLETGEQILPEHVLIVDPHFAGPLPLASVACEMRAEQQGEEERRYHLRFVDLPSGEQSAIIRSIHRQQIQAGQFRRK